VSWLRVLFKALLLLPLLWAGAAKAEPTDTAVKAAFLPRFARYVTWPAGAMPKGSDPFVLCVMGHDPFGPMLDDAARSQLIDGRRIVVRRVGPAEADGCHILFLSGRGEVVSSTGRPVLTVTDTGNGGARGIINFVISEGRVRFFIDQRSAIRRGLIISSRLLALAVGVRQ
jgi:hypothetical protein